MSRFVRAPARTTIKIIMSCKLKLTQLQFYKQPLPHQNLQMIAIYVYIYLHYHSDSRISVVVNLISFVAGWSVRSSSPLL